MSEQEANPQVSVIMSVYNGVPYVRRAIESILTQTFQDWELVLVNDASSDETLQIISSYPDPRIRLLENQVNVGLTKSLNRAIRASRGSYLARQDADDYSLPDRLTRQVAFLDAHPGIGLVGSAAHWIDAEDRLVQDWQPQTDPPVIQQTLLHAIPFLHGTFMFRRSCLADLNGGYNEERPVAQDCDLLLRLSDRWELANLPEILYVHRGHAGTITSKRFAEQKHQERLAQEAAVRRRLSFGRARVRLGGSIPEWVRTADPGWLSRRYLWWSAAARALDKRAALEFLLIAFLLKPQSPEVWKYVRGIARRKTARGIARARGANA